MGELSEMAEKISKFQERAGTEYTTRHMEKKDAGLPVKKQYHKVDKPSQAPLSRNIKLQGEAKDNYLNNLSNCIIHLQRPSENLDSIYNEWKLDRLKDTTNKDAYLWLNKKYHFSKQRTDFTQNIGELISVLKEKPQIEISLATGMPTSAMLLAISNTSKNIDTELKELNSKISQGFKEKEKSELTLEDMLIARIKSKIYDFDTPTAEVLQDEGKPLHEIIAPELTLRDRKYFQDAIKNYKFSIGNDIPTAAAILKTINYNSKDKPKQNISYYMGDLSFSGYDYAQGSFSKSIIRFFANKKKMKKIFSSVNYINKNSDKTEAPLKSKYHQILAEAFKRGNIDSLYKEASEIRYFHPWDVMKLTLKRFYDANTDNSDLRLPEDFFQEHDKAFIMDIASERIIADFDMGKYLLDKNYHPETKKKTETFRLYGHDKLHKPLSNNPKSANIKPVYMTYEW